MRTINLKHILSAALLALVGCTDLNVDIKSQYTTFPDSEAAAEAVSANIYNSYRGTLGRDHWMIQTLSSDEAAAVSLGTDWYDNGKYMQMTIHNWSTDNGMIPSIWNSAMNGINTCNQVLTLLGNDDSEGEIGRAHV